MLQIAFPGVTCESFRALQEYLYTGQSSTLDTVDCMELIELANRMCVPRLLTITESFVVKQLTAAEEEDKDVVEDVLMLLEPAQVSLARTSWGYSY